MQPPKRAQTFTQLFDARTAELAECKAKLLNATASCNPANLSSAHATKTGRQSDNASPVPPSSNSGSGCEVPVKSTEPHATSWNQWALTGIGAVLVGVARSVQVATLAATSDKALTASVAVAATMSRSGKALTASVVGFGGACVVSAAVGVVTAGASFASPLLPVGGLVLAFGGTTIKLLGAGLLVGGALAVAENYQQAWNAGALELSFSSIVRPVLGPVVVDMAVSAVQAVWGGITYTVTGIKDFVVASYDWATGCWKQNPRIVPLAGGTLVFIGCFAGSWAPAILAATNPLVVFVHVTVPVFFTAKAMFASLIITGATSLGSGYVWAKDSVLDHLPVVSTAIAKNEKHHCGWVPAFLHALPFVGRYFHTCEDHAKANQMHLNMILYAALVPSSSPASTHAGCMELSSKGTKQYLHVSCERAQDSVGGFNCHKTLSPNATTTSGESCVALPADCASTADESSWAVCDAHARCVSTSGELIPACATTTNFLT